MYGRNSCKHENCKDREVKLYISFWTKEWEIGNSPVDGKEQTFGKQILAGPPRNSGTQRGI